MTFSLFPEVCYNFLHSCHLIHEAKTSGIAVSADNAVRRVFAQCQIMLLHHIIADFRKVIEFIDRADIQACGIWLTVIAVNAFSIGLRRRECTMML